MHHENRILLKLNSPYMAMVLVKAKVKVAGAMSMVMGRAMRPHFWLLLLRHRCL